MDGESHISTRSRLSHQDKTSLTSGRRVLAEVASLVAADEAGRLDLRGGTTGELGVEVHHTVHTGSILSSSDRLVSNVSSDQSCQDSS